MSTTLYRRVPPLAALLLGTATLALPSAPATAAPVPTQAPGGGSWTIMYYGAGDNDAEAALTTDIKEMAGAGLGGDVQVYALLDRSTTDYSDPSGEFVDGPIGDLGDFDTAKVFHMEGDRFVEDLDLGEIDTADPDNLAWFIDQVMRVAPADNTALVFADHGAGAYSFGIDDANGTSTATDMSAQTIAQGIAGGLAASGEKLDLVIFAACLMANFETAVWMSGVADLLVASEDLMPFYAFDYTSLRALSADPGMSPDELASMLVDGYAQSFGGSDFPDTSISTIDLSAVAMLDKAVTKLGKALTSSGDVVGFRAAVADSTAMAPLDLSWGFLDLGDIARRLAQPGHADEVRAAADAVFTAVDNAVVESWGGLARSNVTGMSIAIPQSVDYYDAATYAVLGNPAWSAWLDTVFAQQSDAGAGRMWATDIPDVELLDESGIVISAQLDRDAVQEFGLVNAIGLFGVPTNDNGMQILLNYDAVTDSGERGRVSSSWAYQLFALSDDEVDWVYPTTRLFPAEGITTAAISGTYVDSSGSARAEFDFSIDPQSGAISDVSLWIMDGSGAWSPLTPTPDSTFAPKAYLIGPDGRSSAQELEPLELGNLGITVSQFNMNQGADIAAGLLAVDGGGSESTIFGVTQVP